MSKFNSKATGVVVPTSVNMAGGVSYERNDFKKELVALVFNSMLNGKSSYYETEKTRLERIFKLAEDNLDNAKFLAKTLVYTRKEIGLRSVSHVLSVVLTENVKSKSFVRKALFKSFLRPDDMMEVFSLWKSRNPKVKMTNAMRRAFKDALEMSFDEYQIKKYEAKSSDVKLSDIVKMTHPNPKNFKNKLVFKQLIEGKLSAIQTAQTVNAGSTGSDRAENYSQMIKDRKLGIMAALKNVKNILESDISDETLESLCEMFVNQKLVENSKLLPFRFVDAYETVENEMKSFDRLKLKKVLSAIEKGFILSARNISIVSENEKVAICLDESGSMRNGKGSAFYYGKILTASMMYGLDKEKVVGYLWAERSKEISINKSPMEYVKSLYANGGGTYVSAPIKNLLKTKTNVDVIVIFTDMQMYRGDLAVDTVDTYLNKYKNKINKDVKVLWWNLSGYANGTPSAMKFGYEVSGYSDKMLEVVSMMLKFGNKDYLIDVIENYVEF